MLGIDTGKFSYRINIYKDGIASIEPPKVAGSKGFIGVTSLNARNVEVTPSAEADTQVAKLKFEVCRCHIVSRLKSGLTGPYA